MVGTSLSTCGPAPASPYAQQFAPGVARRDQAKTFRITDLERFDDVELPFAGRVTSDRVAVRAVTAEKEPLPGVRVRALSECAGADIQLDERRTGADGTATMELFDGREWTLKVSDSVPHLSEIGDEFASFRLTRCPEVPELHAPFASQTDSVLTLARCLERDNAIAFALVRDQMPGDYIGDGVNPPVLLVFDSTVPDMPSNSASRVATECTGLR